MLLLYGQKGVISEASASTLYVFATNLDRYVATFQKGRAPPGRSPGLVCAAAFLGLFPVRSDLLTCCSNIQRPEAQEIFSNFDDHCVLDKRFGGACNGLLSISVPVMASGEPSSSSGQQHKVHRKPHKTAAEKNSNRHANGGNFNPRAFVSSSPGHALKAGLRNAELDQKRLHVPQISRTSDDEAPPVIVAIVGPQGVGKTTLMRSLIRRFTKHTLKEIRGPVTVVSGKWHQCLVPS